MTPAYTERYMDMMATRMVAATWDQKAVRKEVKTMMRSETERGKLGIRAWRVGVWELSTFRGFGMHNVTVRRNGRVVCKVGVAL